MPDFEPTAVFTFATQALGAAVMALMLFGFHRQYSKSYLLQWTLGWTSLAVYDIATAGGLMLASRLHAGPLQPLRLVAVLVAALSGYLQIAWLMFGVHELIRRRPVRFLDERRLLGVLSVASVAIAAICLITERNPVSGELTRTSARSLIVALGFIACAFWLFRARNHRHAFGFTVLGVAFLLSGVEQFYDAAANAPWIVAPLAWLGYSTYVAFTGLLLQTVTGVGMIACLLEEEREAAELATVEIEHLAYHDALTGLPNRPLFIDRLIVALAQASRANQRLALFFLDMDRFKDINDSLGHSVGDALLKAVAERIRRCVREGDTVARFGGDEFTMLVPRVDSIEDAAKVAQKVIDTLKIPFVIHERELFVTTSIGITIFPNDGLDPETLVRNADSAMYRAKDRGRDNYQLYAPAMNARALERLALENMLRRAIANDELVLYYQPIVAMETRTIVGAEALIRWQHPELGMLLPAHFISVAEASGLIVPIGEWALRAACRQIKHWNKRIDPDLTISVNLSARQFQQPDLLGQIRRVLADTGVEASRHEIEITESNAMQNAENTIHTLRDLKAIDVRIAMDDFGTGYSSLNYLKRFPIDTLKLDRSFVADIMTEADDAAIVSAVIAMAHSLRLEVVAEGVETEDQFAFLQRHRCDRIQGYLFSEPLAADQLELLLQRREMRV